MKEAAYSGIDDLHNYDIRSAQPSILWGLMKERDINSSFLRSYLDNPNAKYEYADKTGLTTKTWKALLCAMCMGGYLPKDIHRSEGDIRHLLEADLGCSLKAQYRQIYNVVQPFWNDIRRWQDRFIKWIENTRYQGRGGYWIRNKVGCRMQVPTLLRMRKNRGWLPPAIAFILQGREAYFIHTLTVLLDDTNVEVIGNQHDGLVTIGRIPSFVIETAKSACSMPYIYMDDKPFT